MATTSFVFDASSNDWFNFANWSNGVPVPGDTALLSGGPGGVQTDDLLLSQTEVFVANTLLAGNVLTLADSHVVGEEASGIDQKVIVVDGQSTLGISQTDSSLQTDSFKDMSIDSPLISNSGTIGSVGGGTLHIAPGPDETRGSLINNSIVTAANGGSLQLINEDVSGTGRLIIANGGKMEFIGATESQAIDFGGTAATELSFDPSNNTLNGTLTRFDLSDVIDLENFTGTLAPITSLIDPSVHIAGANPAGGRPVDLTLNFSGDFAGHTFTLVPDTNQGMDLLLI